jgi:dipeptidyl aminopeptidase/acylaminoacyl peptidase
VINTKTRSVTPLVSGADFYAAPRFSPDGTHLAWQQWCHPDMPWEGGEIYVAIVDTDGIRMSLRDKFFVGGKKSEVSAGYPAWASKETLFFTSDISGYQNPWKYSLVSHTAAPILSHPMDENFSDTSWTLGGAYGDIVDSDGATLLFTASKEGRAVLYLLSTHGGTWKPLDHTYSDVSEVRRVATGSIVFCAQTVDGPASIVLVSLTDPFKPSFRVIKSFGGAATGSFPRELFSIPQPITLEVSHRELLYVTYYPPSNPEYIGPDGEKPPCILHVHGGPTSNESQSLNWQKQYFTSRGWAWCVAYSDATLVLSLTITQQAWFVVHFLFDVILMSV